MSKGIMITEAGELADGRPYAPSASRAFMTRPVSFCSTPNMCASYRGGRAKKLEHDNAERV